MFAFPCRTSSSPRFNRGGTEGGGEVRLESDQQATGSINFFPFPHPLFHFIAIAIFSTTITRQDFSKFLLRVYVIVEFIKKEKEKRSNEKPMFDRAGGHNLLEKMMDAERKQEFVLK